MAGLHRLPSGTAILGQDLDPRIQGGNKRGHKQTKRPSKQEASEFKKYRSDSKKQDYQFDRNFLARFREKERKEEVLTDTCYEG